jgi:16S rRNA (guanine(1405)-N(7))-methyltransferase
MKRKVYNDLRRYFQSSCDTDKIINNINDVQKDTDEGRDFFKKLLQQHVSTRERIEELDNFYDPVISYILSSKSILDVGCGINPLMVPFNSSDSKVEKYIAVDKDKKSIKIVDEYSKWLGNAKLEGINWDIKEGWDKLYNITGIKEYDIALIMKVITVVKRQESELLSILRDTPAKYLLITGSKTSMTKKCSIEKREKNDVIRFIEDNAWLKVLEFDRKEEFGWLVRKG